MQDFNDQNNRTPDDRLTLVQSYLAWWDIAGFDHNVSSKTVNWLEQKSSKSANRLRDTATSQAGSISNAAPDQDVARRATSLFSMQPQSGDTVKIVPPDQLTLEKWPDNLDDFHTAIESGEALPGNSYGNDHIKPRMMENDNTQDQPSNQKTIMLISDFPNEQDSRDKILLSGKQDRLIHNMMLACGFQNHNIYMASLASTRPIYDEFPVDDLSNLHALMRHHIGLVDPDAIIGLGSAACNALLGADLMNSRENLHYFNHNGQNKKLITTFHPRSLLAKPQLKRQAWTDLQILIKKGLS